MFGLFHQGDIVKVEKIKYPVLVVSKDFFNTTKAIMGCPVLPTASESPLHIYISTKDVSGYVQCEAVKMLDLRARGCKKIEKLQTEELNNIADAIQSIFDYM